MGPRLPIALKQSRYEACRSNYKVWRSNLSRDLGSVTNLELTARTVKALEVWTHIGLNSLRYTVNFNPSRHQSMEWWKTTETATALGRNHYQVWNGGRRLRLLRHSVRTTTKCGMVEDVWDCYGTRPEPLPSTEWWREVETATALDLEVLWGCDGSTADPSICGLKMDQDDVWSLYIIRRLDAFKEYVRMSLEREGG